MTGRLARAGSMWRNYLVVGTRALAKSRVYAFINIVGLAIGLAACLLLLIYVRYERSYDAWLPDADRLYQLQTHYRDPGTGEQTDLQWSSYVAGQTLAADFDDAIDRKVYAMSTAPVIFHNGGALPTQDAVYVDGNLFEIMAVPFVRGDPASALAEVGSVVLSQSESRRLYGDADPVGRTLTLIARGQHVDHRVTGVIADLPRNSHQRFSLIARFDPASYFTDTPDFLTEWGVNGGWNYLRLRAGADPATITAGMAAWERRNIPDQQFGDQMLNQGDFTEWRLVNVRDVHLGTAQAGSATAGTDERTILTFTIVAFLILGMACINFTNLATARAGARAREVALRKVLGASRAQLMNQFLVESMVVAATAMLLALALAELMLPIVSRFLEADLAMRYLGADGMLLPILLLTVLVGAAGGLYPAVYLTRFQPAQVLRANKSSAEPAGSGLLRSSLVIGQFAVSIGLIICTAVIWAQTVHARSADPGFRREGLLQVHGLNRRQIIDQGPAIAREIARVPGVTAISRTGLDIDPQVQNGTVIQVPGRAQPVGVGTYTIDDAYFGTMGMELVAGRLLGRDIPADVDPLGWTPSHEQERALVARGLNIVVNQRAARDLGFADPAAAIGAELRMGLVRPENGLVPVTIVGVVRDARLRSIREPMEPVAFRLGEGGLATLMVRFDDPEPRIVRDRIAATWRRLAPDVPFEAEFSDEVVARQYLAEESRARIFAGFALLAVVVACLGLFGLAAFTAERRTKEIGIRKVLGARTADIVRLLAWQFSKPVIIANLVAWPVAWWVMRDWLNTFDTRVDLGVAPFLAAGLLALLIALGTVASHAFRVARANPIHALRYE